ncbi:MAG: hypothetical protein ACOCWJ_05615 [Verrucomicrobiota bacterium]
MVNLLERLLLAVTSPTAQNLLQELAIHPRSFFAEIKPGNLAKINAFLTKRLSSCLDLEDQQ